MPRYIVGAILMAVCLLLFGIVFLGMGLKLIPIEFGAWIAAGSVGGGYYGATMIDCT